MYIPQIAQKHALYALAGVCAVDSAVRVAKSMSLSVYLLAKRSQDAVNALVSVATIGALAATLSQKGINSFLSFNSRFTEVEALVLIIESCAFAGLGFLGSYQLEKVLSARWDAQFKIDFGEKGNSERPLTLVDLDLRSHTAPEDTRVGVLKKSFGAPEGVFLEKSAALTQVICFAILGALGKMRPKLLLGCMTIELISFLALSSLKYARTWMEITLTSLGGENSVTTVTVGNPLFPSGKIKECTVCFGSSNVKVCKVHALCTACLKSWMESQTIDKIGKEISDLFWPFPRESDTFTGHKVNGSVVSYSFSKAIRVKSQDLPNCPVCRLPELISISVTGNTRVNGLPLRCELIVIEDYSSAL
jgi:hypothetical protein